MYEGVVPCGVIPGTTSNDSCLLGSMLIIFEQYQMGEKL
jgi:hypothetical protein